ncbi:MAG: glycosyltransferase family 4 protein [Acidobacteriota bacterium]
MRIAIVSSSRRKFGGIETYLEAVIPALRRSTTEVAFWYENDEPESREQIALDEKTPTWSVSKIGAVRALAGLRAWAPTVVYGHGLLDPKLEAATLEVAPAAFFAHAYYGTCISGSKTWSNPTVRTCTRNFGALCLVHYFPHRCGGLSPLTMFSEYRRQKTRLELLHRYRYVLTGSEHMRAEFANHGLNVRHVPLFVPTNGAEPGSPASQLPSRILFLGRMDRLKGGLTLLTSLPRIRQSLGRPLHVTFAGDGPERRLWESEAARMQVSVEDLSFDFPGWVNGDAHETLFAGSDLLVMPSLWPEPFGLVGPQAGLHGVPAVAFAVGGISDWLKDGVNGYLAPGDPPTSQGLAEAIVKCFSDPALHLRLRNGAATIARRFSASEHVSKLMRVFEEIAGSAGHE